MPDIFHVLRANPDGTPTAGTMERIRDAAGQVLAGRFRPLLDEHLPPAAKAAGIGAASGVPQVSGTVTLDGTGAPIREFFTTGATTFKANGVDTPIGAYTAVVWRRTAQGVWGYRVVQDEWTTPATTPTPTPGSGVLAAPTNLKATATADGAALSWTAVAGATGYDVRVNNSAWTRVSGTSYTVTGLGPGSHVAEVQTVGGYSATVGFTVALPAGGFTWGVDGFETDTAVTTLDKHSKVFKYVAGGGEGWPTAIATVENGIAREGGSARVAVPSDDARMHVSYRMTSSSLRLQVRGKSVEVAIDLAGKIKVGSAVVSDTNYPYGVLTLTATGSTLAIHHNGTLVKDGIALGVKTSDLWGFDSLGGLVYGIAFSDASQPLTVPTFRTAPAAGATILSEGFTGADTASVAGRTLDNSLGGTFPAVWDARAAGGGWTSPALGITGGKAVRVGTGSNASFLAVPFEDYAFTFTVPTIPDGGEFNIGLAVATSGGTAPAGVKITPTAVQPYAGSSARTSLGAPQEGDTYTVTVKGVNATVTGARAGGATIGTDTFPITRTGGRYTSIRATAGNTTGTLDNLIWKGV